jgi:tripartite-type tricarboxylate transporter receptor subunit TctC
MRLMIASNKTRTISRYGTLILCAALMLITARSHASAQSAEEHFRGKEIRLLIGSSAGGGYDTFARTIASHWGKHIPGNPIFVPQNLPGPMSLPVANRIFSNSPNDGLTIGAVNPQIASDAILHPDRARFDARKFIWIGSALRETQVMIANADAPVAAFGDAFSKELILGGSGGASDTFPTATNAILGTKFRIVAGYKGTREAHLAMQRGEVQGIGGITWASIKATMGEPLAAKKIVLVAQFGLKKHPDLPDVPHVLSFTKTEDQRAALLLPLATQEFGRPYIAPPDLPPAIAQALRTSFWKTMQDPEFLADAKARGLDIDPVGGEEIQRLVEQLYTTPPAVVERMRAVYSQTGK